MFYKDLYTWVIIQNMDIEVEIRTEFEKHRDDPYDVYMEGYHPFDDYIKNMINKHGIKSINILDELLFEYPNITGSQIISFMYYTLPNHKDVIYYYITMRIHILLIIVYCLVLINMEKLL